MATTLRLATPSQVTLEDACEAYLNTFCGSEQKSTRRAYGQALGALAGKFEGIAVSDLDPGAVAKWFTWRYGPNAPATWNLRLDTLRYACAWWAKQGWLTGDPLALLERRKPRQDASRALSRAEVGRLIGMRSAPLRDRLLWCMLYETAARASEILSLDADELDIPNNSARVLGKGSRPRIVAWQTRTANMLTMYLKGRKTGPLFLATRHNQWSAPACDRDPATGLYRLGYRQAEEALSRRQAAGRCTSCGTLR